jgi:hypothetical protein
MQKSKFRGVVVGTSVGLVAFGSVASAAFLASGELNAPVKAGTVVEMETEVVVPTNLFPGYLEDVTITVTNPNPVETRVTKVTFSHWETSVPGLAQWLVAAPSLALNGQNPTTGALPPLVLKANETKSVTLENAVGLAANTPNQSTQNTGAVPFQGADAVAVYTVEYVASPGTETVGTAAMPKK